MGVGGEEGPGVGLVTKLCLMRCADTSHKHLIDCIASSELSSQARPDIEISPTSSDNYKGLLIDSSVYTYGWDYGFFNIYLSYAVLLMFLNPVDIFNVEESS